MVSAREIQAVAELLQVSPEGLQKAITFKVTVSLRTLHPDKGLFLWGCCSFPFSLSPFSQIWRGGASLQASTWAFPSLDSLILSVQSCQCGWNGGWIRAHMACLPPASLLQSWLGQSFL